MTTKDAVELSQVNERASAPVLDKSNTHDKLGATLAAARVASGRELEDIARETRVPLRHLRAIEADAHDSLPALPYTIGFVKSFARAVGLDGEAAGARFRAETSKTAHVPALAMMEPLDERRLPSRRLVMISVVLLVLLLAGLTAYGSGWFDAPPATQTVAVAETPTVVAPAATSEPSPVVVPIASEPAAVAPATAAVPGGSSGVSIIANEDAWVRITALSPETGKIVSVRTGILTKGERYELPASPPGQRLWTGRAGALRIMVNGRALPPLGGPVETVKNVSLTPADLLARATPAAVPAAAAR